MTPLPLLLEGYRALDLTNSMGALCGKLLGDLGMEVVKLEPPWGDEGRLEPPFAEGNPRDQSLRFLYLNSGKRGITLDLSRRRGTELFQQLVKGFDVVLESYPPGYLAQLGLGYAELCRHHPSVILVSISPFGQEGPLRDWQAADIVTTAMGGLLYISGDPGLPPCMPPETQSYYYGSLYSAYGVMLALWRRETQGKGVHIDASVQASIALHEHVALTCSVEGKIGRRAGSQHYRLAPANLFPCRDGFISIFVIQSHWPVFLELWKDHPPDLDHPRWINNSERRAHAEWLNEQIATFTRNYLKDDLTALLQKHRIPALPVNSPSEFMQDPQTRARQLFAPVSHPGIGAIPQVSAPFTVDGERPLARPAPALGQHNREVFGDQLGLDRENLALLAEEKII